MTLENLVQLFFGHHLPLPLPPTRTCRAVAGLTADERPRPFRPPSAPPPPTDAMCWRPRPCLPPRPPQAEVRDTRMPPAAPYTLGSGGSLLPADDSLRSLQGARDVRLAGLSVGCCPPIARQACALRPPHAPPTHVACGSSPADAPPTPPASRLLAVRPRPRARHLQDGLLPCLTRVCRTAVNALHGRRRLRRPRASLLGALGHGCAPGGG